MTLVDAHCTREKLQFEWKKRTLRLVASANSPTVVELIRELLYCNYLEFQKARFKIIHYKNTFNNVFN